MSVKELQWEIKKTKEIINNTQSKYLKRDRTKYLNRLIKELKKEKRNAI